MANSKIGPYVNQAKFYTGMFGLLFQGHFGVWCIVSKWPVSRTQESIGGKRSEIWKSGVAVNMYMGYL